MSNCSFVKTDKEMAYVQDGANAAWMKNCEGLYVAWSADAAILAKVVPAPLKLAAPLVIAYVIETHNPTFSTAYKEAALLIPVTNGDKGGNYSVALLLTGSDNPVTTGREEFGIPKKNASAIELRRLGDKAYATVERMGVQILDIEVELGNYNTEMGANVFGNRVLNEFIDGVSYFHKFDIDQDSQCNVSFSNLRLINVRSCLRYHTWEPGAAQVELKPSINDPWAELAVLQPLGAAWATFDLGLLGCQEQIALSNIDEVIPRLIAGRYDSPFFGAKNQIL
ncbi:MAG: acetoacetate decarboxylase family protein [Coriobacteriales bacterium]|jgi:acetoacetate decarboxylase|nr:acetoacetate decarboxylase family protein [Coriobacteriales bacterium]